MVRDALSNYLTLASGLTEVTRQRARAAAKALVAQGGASVEQVSGLAEEIVQTSRANRTALVNLVRYEIEHALGRLGLASAEDLTALRQRVADIEQALRDQGRPPDAAAPAAEPPPDAAAPAAEPRKAAKKTGAAKKAATPAKKAGRAARAGGTEVRE